MNENNHENEISRRDFLGLASSTLGAISLAGLGSSLGWAENIVKVDVKNIQHTQNEVDVLVIGGGMAGLFAAVKAHDTGVALQMRDSFNISNNNVKRISHLKSNTCINCIR